MKCNSIQTVVLASSMFWSTFALAQCDPLLKGGVYEYNSRLSDEQNVSTFVNYARDQQRSASSSSSSGDAGLNVKVISATLKGSQDKKDEAQRDILTYNKTDIDQRNRLLTIARTASKVLADAFVECMKIDGLHVWLEPTPNPETFKIAAINRDPREKPRAEYLKSIDIDPPNVSCRPALPNDKKKANAKLVGGATVRYLCTRQNCKPLTATINASTNPVGGGDLTLPSYCKDSDEDDGAPGNLRLCPALSLQGRSIAVHYSAQNTILSTVQVSDVLRAAGAIVTPVEKPRAETSIPKYVDYRIYFKDSQGSEVVASQLKRCVSKISRYKAVESYVFTPGILAGPMARFDAVVYAVEQ